MYFKLIESLWCLIDLFLRNRTIWWEMLATSLLLYLLLHNRGRKCIFFRGKKNHFYWTRQHFELKCISVTSLKEQNVLQTKDCFEKKRQPCEGFLTHMTLYTQSDKTKNRYKHYSLCSHRPIKLFSYFPLCLLYPSTLQTAVILIIIITTQAQNIQ